MILPDVLYHGTSTKYLDQILKDGLLPCSITGAVPMTCLADDFAVAEHHARCQADAEDADPIVFSIPIERFQPAAFTLEDKFVELGPSHGRGCAVYEAMDPDEWEAKPWTWQEMLMVAGAVGYTVAIPVTSDDIHRIGEPAPAP